jgi:Tfp pilus assembly protein PilP
MPTQKLPPPETRLLALIKGQNGQKKAMESSLNLPRELFHNYIKPTLSDPFKLAQWIFLFLTGATLIGGIVSFWGGVTSTGRSIQNQVEAHAEQSYSQRKSLSYYLAPLRIRSIFQNPTVEKAAPIVAVVKPTPGPTAPPPPPKPTLAELASDLTLLGVISSGDPQAIISSKKTQKTFYVTVGQMIGEIRISRITENRVQLTYDNQTMELSL